MPYGRLVPRASRSFGEGKRTNNPLSGTEGTLSSILRKDPRFLKSETAERGRGYGARDFLSYFAKRIRTVVPGFRRIYFNFEPQRILFLPENPPINRSFCHWDGWTSPFRGFARLLILDLPLAIKGKLEYIERAMKIACALSSEAPRFCTPCRGLTFDLELLEYRGKQLWLSIGIFYMPQEG